MDGWMDTHRDWRVGKRGTGRKGMKERDRDREIVKRHERREENSIKFNLKNHNRKIYCYPNFMSRKLKLTEIKHTVPHHTLVCSGDRSLCSSEEYEHWWTDWSLDCHPLWIWIEITKDARTDDQKPISHIFVSHGKIKQYHKRRIFKWVQWTE